jgi:septin family protein
MSDEGNDDSYVGFANLPNQLHRKSVKKGFEFTLMVMGESGLGKSTFVNALFQRDFRGERVIKPPQERIATHSSAKITTEDITERMVRLRLTVVDIPGYADAVDNTNSCQPALDYILEQFDNYLEQESRVKRKTIVDTRVHALVYFIPPSSHGLRPIDIATLKQLHDKVNLVPVIAKADTLTVEETKTLKYRIKEDLEANGINTYQLPVESDEDEDIMQEVQTMQAAMPFAIVSTDEKVNVNGRMVYGRKYPWGVVEMENEKHCEFTLLRNMLVRERMHDLKEITNDLYENHRAMKLEALDGEKQDE